jgi:peptidoglycan/xylan/chitin deacetylase (PgdA/CDA1 family)
MYHGVIPEQPGRNPVELAVVYQEDFDRQLRWLRHFFAILHPDEYADLLERGARIPRRAALVTVDDGCQNLVDYAEPIARLHGIALLAFVCTGHLDSGDWLWFARALASRLEGHPEANAILSRADRAPLEAIHRDLERAGIPKRQPDSALGRLIYDGASREGLRRAVDRGTLVLGGHTSHHPHMSRETASVNLTEIRENKEQLEAIAGRAARWFAYPAGDVTLGVAQLVRESGYTAAMAIHPPRPGFPQHMHRFHVPRTGIYHPGRARFALKCLGMDYWRGRLASLGR